MRKSLIAKINIAKKELGLDDDVYRDLLYRLVKKNSTKDCNPGQLMNILDELKKLGWKNKPKKEFCFHRASAKLHKHDALSDSENNKEQNKADMDRVLKNLI